MLPPGAGLRLAAVGMLAGVAGWLATNSLQQDFSAYYAAGRAVGLGADPYVNGLSTAVGPGAGAGTWDGVAVYRHSRFLYPPLAAQLFRPLAALPFSWAKLIFTCGAMAALWAGLAIVARAAMASPDRPRHDGPPWLPRAWLPLACALWMPVLLSIERGQMDLLLLAALAAAWRWRHRIILAGALLAVAAFFKPMVLGVLPLLIAARQVRWAVAFAGVLVVLVAVNVALSGRAQSETYLREVLPRAASHGEGGPEELLLPAAQIEPVADDLAAGIARKDGRVYRQEIGSFRRNASLPRLMAGDDTPSPFLIALVAFLLVGGLCVGARRSPDSPAWYWGGLVAGVVAAPVSWAMGLVWALPLFCVSDGRESLREPVPRVLLAVAFVAAMVGPLFAPAWVMAALAAVSAAAVATANHPPAQSPS